MSERKQSGAPANDEPDPDAPGPLDATRTVAPGAMAPESVQSERLELYKLAVEMADRVSSRRTSANHFFLALHAAFASILTLLGLGSVAGADPSATAPTGLVRVGIVVAVGILLCFSWYLILRSYRDLNAAKFKVINAIERDLPVRVFTDEWGYLKDDEVRSWRGRYREQGTVEQVVPFLFAITYVLAGTIALCQ